MNRTPRAMLMMSSTPKISVRPTALRAETPPTRIPSTMAWVISRAINHSVLVGSCPGEPGRAASRALWTFVRASGPDKIAVFAIRPDRTDIGGTGVAPRGKQLAQPVQAGLVERINNDQDDAA